MSFDALTQLAAESEAFLSVIDPDDVEFLHPGDMPSRIQKYCANTNQRVPQTKGQIIRVALESIALKYRLVLERLEELSGKRLDPLHIIGGGTKNQLLNQFTADLDRAYCDHRTCGSNRHWQYPDAGNWDETSEFVSGCA